MKALELANYVICYANDKFPDNTITHLKLQKILYYIVTSCLKKNKDIANIFSDGEAIEKWQFGPVIPSVYNEFKSYGGRPITSPSLNIAFEENGDDLDFSFEEFNSEKFAEENPEIAEIAVLVINNLIKKDAFTLVDMTHNEKAWSSFEENIKKGDRDLIYSNNELRSATAII